MTFSEVCEKNRKMISFMEFMPLDTLATVMSFFDSLLTWKDLQLTSSRMRENATQKETHWGLKHITFYVPYFGMLFISEKNIMKIDFPGKYHVYKLFWKFDTKCKTANIDGKSLSIGNFHAFPNLEYFGTNILGTINPSSLNDVSALDFFGTVFHRNANIKSICIDSCPMQIIRQDWDVLDEFVSRFLQYTDYNTMWTKRNDHITEMKFTALIPEISNYGIDLIIPNLLRIFKRFSHIRKLVIDLGDRRNVVNTNRLTSISETLAHYTTPISLTLLGFTAYEQQDTDELTDEDGKNYDYGYETTFINLQRHMQIQKCTFQSEVIFLEMRTNIRGLTFDLKIHNGLFHAEKIERQANGIVRRSVLRNRNFKITQQPDC